MAGHRGLKADYSITTVSVTLVLLLLGVVGYILINAYSSGSAVRSELRVSVMLTDTVTQAQRAAIEKRMGIHPAIATWRYVSADEAARDFQTYIGTDFVGFLGENPLPASYELVLHPTYAEAPKLAELEHECNTWKGVDEVVYQRKIVETVMRNLNRLNVILLGLGGFLLLITVMLISNTLRLAVAGRRQAIATMKLVGATPSFIRRPFVRRSFTQGVVAGLLAAGLLYLFADGLAELLPEVKLLTDRETFALLASAMVLLGVCICTTFTALAVNRYVKLTDDFY